MSLYLRRKVYSLHKSLNSVRRTRSIEGKKISPVDKDNEEYSPIRASQSFKMSYSDSARSTVTDSSGLPEATQPMLVPLLHFTALSEHEDRQISLEKSEIAVHLCLLNENAINFVREWVAVLNELVKPDVLYKPQAMKIERTIKLINQKAKLQLEDQVQFCSFFTPDPALMRDTSIVSEAVIHMVLSPALVESHDMIRRQLSQQQLEVHSQPQLSTTQSHTDVHSHIPVQRTSQSHPQLGINENSISQNRITTRQESTHKSQLNPSQLLTHPHTHTPSVNSQLQCKCTGQKHIPAPISNKVQKPQQHHITTTQTKSKSQSYQNCACLRTLPHSPSHMQQTPVESNKTIVYPNAQLQTQMHCARCMNIHQSSPTSPPFSQTMKLLAQQRPPYVHRPSYQERNLKLTKSQPITPTEPVQEHACEGLRKRIDVDIFKHENINRTTNENDNGNAYNKSQVNNQQMIPTNDKDRKLCSYRRRWSEPTTAIVESHTRNPYDTVVVVDNHDENSCHLEGIALVNSGLGASDSGFAHDNSGSGFESPLSGDSGLDAKEIVKIGSGNLRSVETVQHDFLCNSETNRAQVLNIKCGSISYTTATIADSYQPNVVKDKNIARRMSSIPTPSEPFPGIIYPNRYYEENTPQSIMLDVPGLPSGYNRKPRPNSFMNTNCVGAKNVDKLATFRSVPSSSRSSISGENYLENSPFFLKMPDHFTKERQRDLLDIFMENRCNGDWLITCVDVSHSKWNGTNESDDIYTIVLKHDNHNIYARVRRRGNTYSLEGNDLQFQGAQSFLHHFSGNNIIRDESKPSRLLKPIFCFRTDSSGYLML